MHEDSLYDEAYSILQNSRLFSNIDEKTCKGMFRECKIVKWKKSETIDPQIGTKYLHIIVKGRLKVTLVDPATARSIAPFLLSEGDIFDFFSLLDGKEHIVFPIAMDNVESLYLPLQRAREWICEHPEFNISFLPYLGEKMRELEHFGESIVFESTATRLAKLILKHTVPQEKNKDEHCYPVKLINNLSHESLAELIGSVRSVVSTQMHKLKEDETILSKRGHLGVKNLEKLIKSSENI